MKSLVIAGLLFIALEGLAAPGEAPAASDSRPLHTGGRAANSGHFHRRQASNKGLESNRPSPRRSESCVAPQCIGPAKTAPTRNATTPTTCLLSKRVLP